MVYAYDSLSHVVQLTDPKGQVYAYRYNSLGWVNATVDAATGDPAANRKDSLEYIKTGVARKHINRRSQVTLRKFDHLGRDSIITLADGRQTTFAYDPGGLWAADSNSESIDTVRTDTAGLVQTQISRRAASRYVVTATADMNGLLRSRVFTMGTDPTSLQTVSYGYDAEWRLDTLSVGTQRTYFGYNTDGVLAFVRLTQHSGATLDSISYTVTGAHRQYSATHSASGLQVFNTLYTRDSLDHIVRRIDVTHDTTWNYAYNALGELTTYDNTAYSTPLNCSEILNLGEFCFGGSNPTTVRSSTFAYDSVGNRTDGSPTIVAGNRLTTWNGSTLTYDYDGNLTHKIGNGLDQYLYWNSIGQLDSVKTNGALVSFGYDGAGRRVRKTVGTAVYKYVYDGAQILTVDSLGTRVRTYSYYPGVDRPHSMIDNAGHRYYYFSESGVGSVIGIIDTVGGIKNHYQYAPFGTTEVTSELVSNPYRYAGREYDPETQLYYYRARYHDPSVARFVSEDPTGLATDINQYRYAADDPINVNDPSGMMNDSDFYEMHGGPFGDVMGLTSFGNSMDSGISWSDWDRIVAEIEASFAEEDAQRARQQGCANFRDNCERLRTTIKQLENSGETHCEDLGINAMYRLERGSLFYAGDNEGPKGDIGVYANPTQTQKMADRFGSIPQSWLADGVIGLYGSAFAGGSRYLFKVLAHEEAHAVFGVDDGEGQYHAQLSGDDPRNPATGWAVACQGMYDHTNP